MATPTNTSAPAKTPNTSLSTLNYPLHHTTCCHQTHKPYNRLNTDPFTPGNHSHPSSKYKFLPAESERMLLRLLLKASRSIRKITAAWEGFGGMAKPAVTS